MALSHDGGRRDAQTGNAGNAQGSGCLAMTSAPTDDELGMKWWNELSERERAHWASAAGTGRAKDAWELWKAGPLATGADDPLADAHAALLRAIAELRALGITVPIALHQAVHALTYARAGGDQAPTSTDCEGRSHLGNRQRAESGSRHLRSSDRWQSLGSMACC